MKLFKRTHIDTSALTLMHQWWYFKWYSCMIILHSCYIHLHRRLSFVVYGFAVYGNVEHLQSPRLHSGSSVQLPTCTRPRVLPNCWPQVSQSWHDGVRPPAVQVEHECCRPHTEPGPLQSLLQEAGRYSSVVRIVVHHLLMLKDFNSFCRSVSYRWGPGKLCPDGEELYILWIHSNAAERPVKVGSSF